MNPTRVLRSLLAERLGQTAGRWPREMFGEMEAPTLRQAIAERVSPSPQSVIEAPAPIAPPEQASRMRPDAGGAREGTWVDVYTGMRGDVNRPWRGHEWTVRDRATASAYGPNMRQMQGDISNAPVIRTEADLRALLGDRADGLLRGSGDTWEYIDNPAVRDALRGRGVSVVRVADDMVPDTPARDPRFHESYLFLDENRLRAPPDGGSAQAGSGAARFRLKERTSTGGRRYVVPIDENYSAELLVGGAPERSVMHWSIVPADGVRHPYHLPTEQQQRLALRAVRGIEQAIASDAAEFAPRAYAFMPRDEQRGVFDALARRLQGSGYEHFDGDPYIMEFRLNPTRAQPNAGPPRNRNGGTVAALTALPAGALTLRELLRDHYGAA